MRQSRPDWFEQRRDFFVREVFDSFFRINYSFQEIYTIYLECRRPHSIPCVDLFNSHTGEALDKIWSRLIQFIGTEVEKGPLWQLKDLCHMMWPKKTDQQGLDGSLVDWLIGSVFHEGMKLKENIYLLKSYGSAAYEIGETPASQIIRERSNNEGLPPHYSHIVDVQGLVNRIGSYVVNQMERVANLLGQVNYLLRIMVSRLGDNMLVVRLLAENEKVLADHWGERLEAVFEEMFYGNVADGFCAAGRSYMRGQWYLQALDMYRRALLIDNRCSEAIVKRAQLQAVVDENSDVLGVA